MTTFDALGLPIFDATDKIAATGDGLREDMNLIGASARNAITAEGARAEGAAKDYADTKDTSNRAAWAAADTAKLAEAKAYTDERDEAYRAVDRALWRAEDDEHEAAANAYTDAAKWDRGVTAADLNTVQSSGRYTVNATNVVNQPVAAAGSLEVLWGSTTGTQRYTVRETSPRVYYRNYSSGTWSAWGLGDAGVRLTAAETSITAITGRELPDRGRAVTPTYANADAITTVGKYQIWTATDAINLAMPSANGGELEVYAVTTIIHQRYWVLETGGWQVYMRRRNAGVWSAWEAPVKTLSTAITARELPDRGRATVASHTNADGLITNGKYQIWSATDAQNMAFPTSNGGEVEVYNIGTVIHQRYWALETGGWQQYVRRRNAGVWSTWEAPLKTATAAAKWEKVGSLTGDAAALDALASGIYHVYNSTNATALGLPVAAGGVLEVVYVTSTAALRTYRTFASPQQNWQQERTGGVWGAWRRLDTPPSVTADIPGSGFKVVPLAVTLPSTGTKYQFTARTERHLMSWNAPVVRWRAHIRNFDYRLNQSLPGAVNFTGLWFGEHDTTSGLSGAYKTAPSQVAGAKTVSDGAEWVTAWFNLPIEAGKEYLLSYGYTTAAGVELFMQVGNVYSSNSSTAAGLQAAPGGTGGALLDVWIEAETYATTPVVAALGDSLSSGVGATYGVRDSWLSQYTFPKKALPLHYTASGDSYGNWTNTAWEKWTRWSGYAKPDALIAALGSNDVFQSVSLAQFQTWFTQVITGLKTTASQNLYLATIMPRTNATGAVETVRRDINTWLRTLPLGARDIFDFAAAMSTDDETIRPEYDADGVHLNTVGYAAVAAAITRPVTTPAVVYQSA